MSISKLCRRLQKKGIIHFSFLAWDGEAYHGKGMYVTDAIMLLETLAPAALMAKVLEVKPRPGAKMSAFGWCPDGNSANCAIGFAMTSLVAVAVVHNHVLPTQLNHALAHINVVYKKHDNNHARFLSNLVETQASRFVNRSGHDPFFLAKEFARNAI